MRQAAQARLSADRNADCLADAGDMPGIGRVEIAGAQMLADCTGCLYWPQEELLVVSDLHLEKGSSFAKRGLMIPPYDTGATLKLLSNCIARWQPELVISLGDSFHDERADTRLPDEYREMLADCMSGRQWIWISGNHDPHAPQGLGGTAAEVLAIGAITFRHEPLRNSGAGEISGHLHPQARIVRRGKSVRRRCFASDGSRLIMPAFGAYTGGLNIRDRAFDGLFDEAGFHAHVMGRERIYTIDGGQLV